MGRTAQGRHPHMSRIFYQRGLCRVWTVGQRSIRESFVAFVLGNLPLLIPSLPFPKVSKHDIQCTDDAYFHLALSGCITSSSRGR